MKLNIPKELRGSKFDKLCFIELNNFDVEMLLPALFWLVLSKGRDRAGQPGSLSKISIEERKSRLASHDRLKGFQNEEGGRLLDKWVRSSLIQTSRIGRGHNKGEQIAHFKPLTFLTYKPTPKEGSRLRQVNYFLYSLCQDFILSRNKNTTRLRDFEKCLQDAFGKGVRVDPGREKKGSYDGSTLLDLETLLEVYYMDSFPAPLENVKDRSKPPEPACYKAALIIARDFIDFLEVYARHVPALTLSRYLVCLLNFELLIYTLRLAKATNSLVFQDQAPLEFDKTKDPSSLELYIDMTQVRGSRSDMLANACVNRDLEGLESYFRGSLTLRTLDRYVSDNRNLQREFGVKVGGEYIKSLWELRDHAEIRADARAELRKIENELKKDGEETIPLEVTEILDNKDLDELARIVEILTLAQRKSAISSLVNWYGDVGGFDRNDGVLRGNTRGRRVWRYVMSDMLLETLVQLAAISPDVRQWSNNSMPTGNIEPGTITLAAFLRFLLDRYGIVIDTPPSFDTSMEATAAAKENFAALKQRLRQMGLFLDLSDDFNAQRIFPRFCPPASNTNVSA